MPGFLTFNAIHNLVIGQYIFPLGEITLKLLYYS